MLPAEDYLHTEQFSAMEREQIETRVLRENMGLVNSLLSQYFGVWDRSTVEDLRQVALLAMVVELRKFSHVDSVEFKKSAAVRMRGALIDELRRRDYAERSVRTLSQNVIKAERILYQRLGREPRAAEVCKAMGITAKQYDSAKSLESIDMDIELNEAAHASFGSGEKDVLALQDAVALLDENEKFVLQLVYVEGLSLEETAQVLKVSVSAIFRLKKRAIEKIKELIGEL